MKVTLIPNSLHSNYSSEKCLFDVVILNIRKSREMAGIEIWHVRLLLWRKVTGEAEYGRIPMCFGAVFGQLWCVFLNEKKRVFG